MTDSEIDTAADTEAAEPAGREPAAGEPADGAGAAWREHFPAESRAMLEQFADPAAFAKSYASLRKEFSGQSGRVKLPGEDADDAAWQAFEEKLPERYRRPTAPDAYDGALPAELDESGSETFTRFRDAMFEAGLPKPAFEAVVNWYLDEQDHTRTRLSEAAAARRRDAEQALRRDWGHDYDANIECAKRAVASVFGDSSVLDRRLADGSEVGNDPAFLRAFAAVGRMIGEDPVRIGAAGTGRTSGLAEEIDRMEREARQGGYYGDAAFQERLQAKYRGLHGARPAGGGVV